MSARASNPFGASLARARSLSAAAVTRGCVLVLCSLCVCFASACASERGAEDTEETRRSRDAWLEEVQRVHQLIDQATNASERERAITSSSNALGIGWEQSFEGSVWVKQDLAARLAGLELEQGRPARALEVIERGLGLSSELGVPLANLYLVRARAHEALDDRAAAVESYHRALVANQGLMERSLTGQ